MTTKTLVLAIGLGVFLLAGTANAGVGTPEMCKEAKAKASGKKAFDLLKAFGKNEKKSDTGKLASGISKAKSKFTKFFSKADAKGGCDTSGDSGTVEETVDAFVAEALCAIVGGCSIAKQVTDTADCVEGPMSRCRVNDYLMENDQIRVVIQDVQRNLFGIGQYGGHIIDADLRRGAGEEERDNFEEWSTQINVENTAHYTDISIVNDGSDGNAAVIRVTGPDDLLDYLNPSTVVTSFGFPFPPALDDTDLPIEISTDYILETGKNYVRVETTVQNTDSVNPVDIFFGEFFNGSGQLGLFLAGYGFGEPQISTACPATAANPCNFLVYRGVDEATGVCYGYVHEVQDPVTPANLAVLTAFNASGVTVPFLGAEVTALLLGLIGPNFALEPQGQVGDQLTFTRYFVVGDGTVASVMEARNEILGLTTGTVTGTVETPTGEAVEGVEIAVLGDPAEGPSALGAIDMNVVAHTVTDASGGFSVAVAPGDYDVVANLEGYPYQAGGVTPDVPALNAATVTAGGITDVGTITLPDTGSLQVLVEDGSANPLPAKASVVGFDPSPPFFNTQSVLGLINNATGVFSDRGADGLAYGLAQVLFIDPAGDSGVIPLEPGDYEVVVSRGPEYSVDGQPIAVVANATKVVNAAIAPVIDTSGFVSADFHVHSIASSDSEVTNLERTVAMMAEGLEFFTPADHEFRGDFQSLIVAEGWESLVTTAANSEITTFDYGHFCAWPMTVDPGQVNGGAPDHGGAAPAGQDFPSYGNHNLTPEEIIALAHADPGTDTVQINHFYSHFGFEQGGSDLGSGLAIDTGLEPPKSAVPPSVRRLDPAKEDPQTGYFTDTFDALEMWIGGGRGDHDNFLTKNAGDWFNLLNQGIVRTGIADSDTHRRILTQSGVPRTMIASSVTDLTLLDPEVHSATVNAGKAIGTNGPMVRVTLEALTSSDTASLELGDPTLVSAADGEVEITVNIQSPVWAEFDTVEYYLNSTTVQYLLENIQTGAGLIDVPRYDIAPDFTDTPTVSTVAVPGGSRLEATSTLTLDGVIESALTEDTWIVVIVKGTDGVSKPLFPVLPNDLDEGSNTSLGHLTDGNLGEDGVMALAFTNPLFVDVDDGAAGPPNGSYDPPGVSFIPAP